MIGIGRQLTRGSIPTQSKKNRYFRKLEKRNGRGVTMSSSSLRRADRKIRDKKIFQAILLADDW